MRTFDESHETACTSGVRIDWPAQMRLVRITGPQRIWFLQNTITTDIEGVEPGRWVESFLLSPKGKVFAHFRVGILEEEIWLEVDSPATELAQRLESMRFRTKVEIEALSRTHVSVVGPSAQVFGRSGDATLDPTALTFVGTLGEIQTADIYTEDPAPLAALQGIVAAPSAVHEVLRIEAGVPAFGVDYGTDNLPQEAGLTSAVSVEKGCYIGQETIARIHFRGHINKVVRTLAFEGVDLESAVGRDLLVEALKVGRITSAVRSPLKGPVGLGIVSVDPAENTKLEVDGGGTATVGPIPAGTKVKTG
jgi:folate-binding protein YgfZ